MGIEQVRQFIDSGCACSSYFRKIIKWQVLVKRIVKTHTNQKSNNAPTALIDAERGEAVY